MGVLLTRLAEKKLLVSDGAWGTMLQAKGMKPGECPEEWNVSHPEEVQSVAKAYAEAGSDLILTNTFGGSRYKLKKSKREDQVEAFNKAGAKNSLDAVPYGIVAASVGPTGEFVEPYGDRTEDELEAAFAEQIKAVFAAGVKVVCIETMTAIEEAVCAIKASKKLDPSADVICTMTFDPTPKGYKTMMGVSCERAAEELTEAGADVVGSNCGNGIEQMIEITRIFRTHTDRPILIHANAGVPKLDGDKTVFRQTPEHMAGLVEKLVEAGASIIGGCCGTTPQHITEMKKAIDRLRG